jgi:hypothetical protein
MTTIDRLIYDALATRRSVVMPGLGTLEVRRRGAKKISDTQIIPPHNVVVFIPDEKESAQSVVAMTAADQGVNYESAAALYAGWLEGARQTDGTLVIEGVGEVNDGVFAATEELYDALNPEQEEIVTMETGKKQTPVWVWILAAVVIALGIAAAILCWRNGGMRLGGSRGTTVETVAPAPDAAAVAAAAAEAQAAALAEAEAARAAAAEAEAAAANRFHVIAGAFSVESNADNFMARVKREHPELTPMKLVNPNTGLHMVSIVQAPTRRQASSKMNLYWDVDLYLWIWEQK